MDMVDIREVYKNIAASLNTICDTISKASQEDDRGGGVFSLIDSAKTFKALQESSQKELRELEENAEFDTFAIAFYGETNAGKSTIIEALRLSFKEKSKLESQAKFKELYTDFSSIQKQIAVLEAKLQELCTQITQNETDLQSIEAETSQQRESLLATIQAQSNEESQKKKDSLWYALKSFFGVTELSKSITAHKKTLQSLEKAQEDKKNDIQKSLNTLYKDKNTIQQDKQHLQTTFETKLELLKPYADGAIIGAQTDFTREITSYSFTTQNNESFILLDVPGIEGSEEEVKSEIKKAVQKAHCVFYVTHKNTPPQSENDTTPDGKAQKGVLETIKEGLRAQSEVWTLYNKRATNMRSLESKEGATKLLLEQRDEEAINAKMQEALGKQYKGTQALSAQYAFFALATCLLPSNKEKQEKIFKEKSTEEILAITHFKDFKDFLEQKILNNAATKIKQSLYSKARGVVSDCESELEKVLSHLNERYKELKDNIEDCHDRLENAANECEQSIKRDVESLVNHTIQKIRKKMYDYIETDVSDSAVESHLKEIVEQEGDTIKEILEQKVQIAYKECEENIKDALERLKRDIEFLLEEMQSFSLSTYNGESLTIQTDSGFELGAFIAGIGGIVALFAFNFWNPVGWFALACGIIGGLIAIGKAVWKMISTSYKMSEQRKSVDEALYKIETKLKDNIKESLKPNIEALKENIEAMQEKVQGIEKSYKSHLNHLCQSQKALKNLAKHITKQGELQ